MQSLEYDSAVDAASHELVEEADRAAMEAGPEPSLVHIVPPLIDLCVEAILKGGVWKYQRRSLERLPIAFAEKIFHRLLRSRQLSPPLLEVFQSCLGEVELSALPMVDASWLAYVGAFTHLHTLHLSACKNVTDASLWHLLGLSSLKALSLACCSRVTDAGVPHILPMRHLRALDVSETGVSAHGVCQFAVLTALTDLRLGGIPTDDVTLKELAPLSQLRSFRAWGSTLTNNAAARLPTLFPHLDTLNLAWTKVTRIPYLPSLTSLDMSQCTVKSLFSPLPPSASPSPLKELTLSGATVHDPAEWPDFPQLGRLDLSEATVHPDFFFVSRYWSSLTNLTLDKTSGLWGLVSLAQAGGSLLPLRQLSMHALKGSDEEELSLRGDVLLSGKLANLESLRVTGWDGGAREWERLAEVLPRLRRLTLWAAPGRELPVAAVAALCSLPHLETLSFTGVTDDVVTEIAKRTQRLQTLELQGDSISDFALEAVATMPRVRDLSIAGGVVTDIGITPLANMAALKRLDLSCCWLLTSQGLSELRNRIRRRRGPHGEPVRIVHERMPSDRETDGGPSGQPFSKRVEAKKPDSNVWIGVGPGGSRRSSAGQPRASGSAPKGRPDRRQSRGRAVDERVRYGRDELVGLNHDLQSAAHAASTSWSSFRKQLPALLRADTSSSRKM